MHKSLKKWHKVFHNGYFFAILLLLMLAQFIMVSISFFNTQKTLKELRQNSAHIEMKVAENRASLESLKRHYYHISQTLQGLIN